MTPDTEQLNNIKNLQVELEQVKHSYREINKLNDQLKSQNTEIITQHKIIKKQLDDFQSNTSTNKENLYAIKELTTDLTKESQKIRSLIGKEFSNLLTGNIKKFKKDLHRLLTESHTKTMNNLLKNIVIGDYDKNKNGLLSGLFKDSNLGIRNILNPMYLGSFLSQFTAQARAIGGPVERSKPYLVGEYGPELFIPSNHGKITPKQGLSSNIAINLTINTPNVDSFRRSQQQIINEIKNNIKF